MARFQQTKQAQTPILVGDRSSKKYICTTVGNRIRIRLVDKRWNTDSVRVNRNKQFLPNKYALVLVTETAVASMLYFQHKVV